MLDHKGFDLWADGYDKTVGLSEESNIYPFKTCWERFTAACGRQTPGARLISAAARQC